MKKIDSNKIRINKIIIFSPNWIGDTVISTVLVNSVKKEFPLSTIVIAANEYVDPIWKENPLVKELWGCELRGFGYIISYFKFILRLKNYHFDLAIILPHCFRYALFAFLAGIPLRLGYNVGHRKLLLTHYLNYDVVLRNEHMLDNYLAILSAIGIRSRRRDLVLRVPAEDEAKAEIFLKTHQITKDEIVIGIGPGAIYGEAKRWPKEKYAEIIEALSKEHTVRIFVFIGPGEEMLAEWLKQNACNRFVIFIDGFSLSEVMSLIKQCSLFIGNDSGLVHLASALNIRTISIFGSTSPRWTAPCGENNIVLNKQLSCGPCFARTCRLGHYSCLSSISVKDVMEAAGIQLKKGSKLSFYNVPLVENN